jgi:hypothetical protein
LTHVGASRLLRNLQVFALSLPAFKQGGAMNPTGRIILGALVRAFRRGVINSSSGYSFTLNDSPMLFTLTAIVHAGGALFFAYIAAGYEAAGFARWFGWP